MDTTTACTCEGETMTTDTTPAHMTMPPFARCLKCKREFVALPAEVSTDRYADQRYYAYGNTPCGGVIARIEQRVT